TSHLGTRDLQKEYDRHPTYKQMVISRILKYNLMDENQGCRLTSLIEFTNVISVNAEEGAVPKLSPEELAIYNILGDAEKVTFLKRYYVNLIIALLIILVAITFNILDATQKNKNNDMIKYFTIYLNSIVFGIQLFWAGIEAIRERSDKKDCFLLHQLSQ
ncbi:35638_t:CDS:2, partial [Gigaspora margarita]